MKIFPHLPCNSVNVFLILLQQPVAGAGDMGFGDWFGLGSSSASNDCQPRAQAQSPEPRAQSQLMTLSEPRLSQLQREIMTDLSDNCYED